MSVLITVKVSGDTDKFRNALETRADEFAKIGEGGRSAGAMHHRFGIGDGFVVAIDEWDTFAHFENFFGDPALQAFIGSAGGDTSVPPTITVAEAVESPDQF